MKPVLEVVDVHTYYGKSHILHGVNLEVREGEIVTLLGRNGAGKSTTLLSVTGLAEKSERVVSELAHGDQRVVEVAIALSLEPKLLMLDEPTAGMGDEETDNMVSLIRRLHDEQRLSILFIEHDMDVVFGIAQRITVLDQGRVLAEGTPQEVGADRRVRAAYLGEAA